MAATKLTDLTVRSIQTEGTFADSVVPGLQLRVRASGAKSWSLRYRKAGRRRRVTLGSYPKLGLAVARKAARSMIGEVAGGGDPAAEKKKERRAETFGELTLLFLRYHASQKAEKTRHEYERIIRYDLMPVWKNRKVKAINRVDVVNLLDKIQHDRKSPVQANRTRALLSKLFNFALERGVVEFSPCQGISRPSKEAARDRVLSDEEVKVFWQSCEDEGPVVSALFRFLLLTGQRSGETRKAKWSDIVDTVWTIPAENSKNGAEHCVPLSTQSSAILEQLMPWTGAGEAYVFASPSNRSSGPIKWLSHAVERVRRRYGFHFTIHDLRRTAASGMGALGVDRVTLGKALNHKTADSGVTAIYDRYDRQREVGRALSKWGARVERIVTGQESAKVVRIR